VGTATEVRLWDAPWCANRTGDALREHFQANVREQWDATGRDLDVFLGRWADSSGANEALTVDMKRLDKTHVDFDVTECKYAQFWRARTHTRMQGASHCQFRITLDRS
jgi:hypothetical protein